MFPGAEELRVRRRWCTHQGLGDHLLHAGYESEQPVLCPSLEPARDGVLMIPQEPQGRVSLGLQVHTCTLPRLLFLQGSSAGQDSGDFQAPGPLC